MNKTININLGGIFFHIDEVGKSVNLVPTEPVDTVI